jgi:hypothetical protein
VTYYTILYTSSGYTGSPGYTKLKFAPAVTGGPTTAEVNAAAAAAKGLFVSLVNHLPTGVSYNCASTAQVFSDAGVLQSEVAVTTLPTTVNGTQAGGYPGGVGAVIYWNTGAVNGGHKVRGRTFMVPMSNAAFAADGTLQTTLVAALQGAVNTFVGSGTSPCVNTRSLGKPGRVNGTIGIISGTVKDRSAFLRTRRT